MRQTEKTAALPCDSSADGAWQLAPRPACVVVIHGEGLGKRVDLGETPVVIGRSPDADLQVPHNSVSRRHCQIWRDGDTYRIRDLGATNGTRVNDAPVEKGELADGDHIRVGECLLKFISHASVEACYHQTVYHLATRDALTELPNRRHFIEALDREIARAARHGKPLAICLVDVDRFKPINDRFGHIAGDVVLRQLAGILCRFVRAGDVAARIGGEEFAVLLPETDVAAAQAFAERLREAVASDTFRLGGDPHRLTISLGIAGLSAGREDRSQLMQAADAALYRAKDEGRNRVCVQP